MYIYIHIRYIILCISCVDKLWQFVFCLNKQDDQTQQHLWWECGDVALYFPNFPIYAMYIHVCTLRGAQYPPLSETTIKHHLTNLKFAFLNPKWDIRDPIKLSNWNNFVQTQKNKWKCGSLPTCHCVPVHVRVCHFRLICVRLIKGVSLKHPNHEAPLSNGLGGFRYLRTHLWDLQM